MQDVLFQDFTVPLSSSTIFISLPHAPQADCRGNAFRRIDHCDEGRYGARHRAGALESKYIWGVRRTKLGTGKVDLPFERLYSTRRWHTSG